jgi:hypothetical protein
MESGPSCQLHRPLNRAYQSPGPAHKCHCGGHHRRPTLFTALPPPSAAVVIASRLICVCGLRGEVLPSFTFSPLTHQLCRTACRRSTAPGAAFFFTAKRLHVDGPLRPSFSPISASTNFPTTWWTSPSTSSASSAGVLPLPPLFPSADPRHCGWAHREHPSSPLPPNGSPISLCRSSHCPRPTPPPGITGNRPAPPPVAMEPPPQPLFNHGLPAHGRPASLVGLVGLGLE